MTSVYKDSDQEKLANYVASQLNNIFPEESSKDDTSRIYPFINVALDRMRPILESVRSFQTSSAFNKYNSLQYATFLYLLSNEVWVDGSDSKMADRLFLLNRTLNSLDLFYKVKMPEVFFLSHALGTVLGNVEFATNLVVFQNVTVGRLGTATPKLGSNVILYPGSSVTGNSIIGDNSVIGAGVAINNLTVPDNTVATLVDGRIKFKERVRSYIDLYIVSK
jgi:serine O-acetyltransferase